MRACRGWPIWAGIPGRFQPERVADLKRNQRPNWAGICTGAELLDGRETVVVETTLSMPGGPGVTVVANLDLLTGVSVREKWEADSQTQLIERRVVDPTAELLARLDKQAILDMAAGFRGRR